MPAIARCKPELPSKCKHQVANDICSLSIDGSICYHGLKGAKCIDYEARGIGKKYDDKKLRYDLIPPDVLEDVAKRFTHGAEKYGENNWQQVKDGKNRYYAALMRHLEAYRMGERIDADSGLSHLSAVIWNAMCLDWLEMHV